MTRFAFETVMLLDRDRKPMQRTNRLRERIEVSGTFDCLLPHELRNTVDLDVLRVSYNMLKK